MEDLSDPYGDRVMKNVPPLARFPLKREDLWHESSEYPTDVASLLEQLPTENINSVFQYICAPTLIEGAKWSL